MSSAEISNNGGDQNLGQQAARGAAVTIAGQAIRVILQVVAVVVLARLVTPTEYGLVAIVLVVVGVGEIFRDFGLSNAAIQSPRLSRPQRDNLFWINTGIGAALALIVFALAGPIASVFEHKELAPMVQVVSITFLFNGMATQYRASLNRELRFRALITCEVAAQASGLVFGVIAGLSGAGYWALIGQQLVQALVGLVLVAVTGKWMPRTPTSGAQMRPFLRFGSNLVGTQLINYASNNIDSVIIGLRFSPADLGFYNRAFQLLMTPLNQLRAPMTTVALPVFSRLQTDFERSARYMRLGQIALGYTVVAGLSIAVGAAESVVRVFLGAGWQSVIPLFALIAVAGSLQTLSFVGYWIYISRGLTGALFRYTLVSASIKIVAVVVGSFWGVLGVATGYAIAPALAWPLSLWWLSRQTPIPLRELWLGALRIICLSCAMGLAAFGAQAATSTAGPFVALLSATAASLIVYTLMVVTIPKMRADARSVAQIVRKVGRRNR